MLQVRRTTLLASAALPLWLAGATSAWAQDQASETPENDEIIVSGIRESLANSIEKKRAANQIVDTITAEDIGKLPDQNIAESIQRVTGVQITRSGGEGFGVNIRGLTALTTINGRVQLGQAGRTNEQASRDYDYRNLAAEFFQAIEVYKSPLASQPEGALGGTVNLVTRKPLDFNDLTLSAGAEGQYSDYVDRIDPRVSVFGAAQMLNDTVGVALSLSYARRNLRSDYFQALGGWVRQTLPGSNSGFDFNAADASTNQDVIRPIDLRFRTQDSVRTRYGADATIQWRPSSDFEARIDANYAKLENEFRNSWLATYNSNQASFVPGSLQIDSNGSLVGGAFVNQQVFVDGRYQSNPLPSYTFAGNLRWTPGAWTIEGDASYTNTKRDAIDAFIRYRNTLPLALSYELLGQRRPPELILSNPDGSPFDLTTPSLYVPNLAQDRIIASDNREYATRLDAKYEFDGGLLSALSVGARATWRDSRFRVRTSANQAANRANPAFFDQATGRQLTAADSPLNEFIGPFPWTLFEDYDGSFPRGWLNGVYSGCDADKGCPEFIDALNIRDFGGLLNSNPEQSDIAEDTIAGYVMADLGGDIAGLEFKANFGVRYVRAKTTSAGVFLNAGTIVPIVNENTDDDFLPAANITLTLMPDLLLRLSGARVLQRPELDQLAVGYNINPSSGVATLGNPNLEPFLANQFDVSLEWYPNRGALISAAAFYKDVKNFTTNTTFVGTIPGVTRLDGSTNFQITQPINGGGGTIKGFEIGVQMPFFFLPSPFDGFGAIANYTYSDSNTASGQPIPRLSKVSYNLIGYFERGGFSARAAYSWRGRYSETGEGGNGAANIGLFEYVAPSGYLDASISYDINKNFTILADGANLLRTKEIRYSGIESRLRDFYITDRRFSLGVRVKL